MIYKQFTNRIIILYGNNPFSRSYRNISLNDSFQENLYSEHIRYAVQTLLKKVTSF